MDFVEGITNAVWNSPVDQVGTDATELID